MSLFAKSFLSETLDQASEDMKARDEALDNMVDQSLSLIPDALEKKKQLDEKMRKRKLQVENFAKANNIQDINVAKAFLNQYDPDGGKNPSDLTNLWEETEYKTYKINSENVSTMPSKTTPNISFPREETTGFFGRFQSPKLGDAITEAEADLNIPKGTTFDTLDFLANQPADPNVLIRDDAETGYGFRTRTQVTPEINQAIGILKNNMAQSYEYAYDQIKGTFAPIAGSGELSNFNLVSNTSDQYDNILPHVVATGSITGGQRVQGYPGQATLRFVDDTSLITGAISALGTDVGNNNYNTQKTYALQKDSSGVLSKAFNDAEDGLVPYDYFSNSYKRATGSNLTYTYKGKTKNLGNSNKRPEFNAAQIIALNENKLSQTAIKDMTKKQDEWDAEEAAKISRLSEVVGPYAMADVFNGIYGRGNVSNIDSAFGDTQNLNLESERIAYASALSDGMSARSNVSSIANFKDYYSNPQRGLSDATVNAINAIQENASSAREVIVEGGYLDEPTYDEALNKGFIPVLIGGRKKRERTPAGTIESRMKVVFIDATTGELKRFK